MPVARRPVFTPMPPIGNGCVMAIIWPRPGPSRGFSTPVGTGPVVAGNRFFTARRAFVTDFDSVIRRRPSSALQTPLETVATGLRERDETPPPASAHPMPVASGGGAPGGGGEGPPRDGRQSPQKVCYFLFRRRRPASHVLPWWVHNPVLSVNGTRFCKASKSGRSISHTNKLSDNAPEKCDSTAA